jgi:hypothetical protein
LEGDEGDDIGEEFDKDILDDGENEFMEPQEMPAEEDEEEYFLFIIILAKT